MNRRNKIIAILGMISTLSLNGCSKMEIPTGEFTTINEDKNEDTVTSDKEIEVEKEELKSILKEYTVDNNIENPVYILSVDSPLSENFKSYAFVKEMEYSTNSEEHSEDSPLFDDIAEVVRLSHLENQEEVLNGVCNFTLIKYQSLTSEEAVYGEEIYNITYDSDGEEKKVELKEQQFGDSEENMYFYALTTTTEEGVRYDWSFIDNEENGYFSNYSVPFELKKYSYDDIMNKFIEYKDEENGATLGLTPQN